MPNIELQAETNADSSTTDARLTDATLAQNAMLAVRAVRVQRSRLKKNVSPNELPVVYVGRPGKWGNPFRAVQEDGLWWVKDNNGNYWDTSHLEKQSSIDVCVRLYSAWIEGKILIKKVDLNDLKNKNLSCWCPLDCKCHADVLLELANK